MLSRRAVSETVERVLDLKPVRKTTSGVRRARKVRWGNKTRGAGQVPADLTPVDREVLPGRNKELFHSVMSGLRQYHNPWSQFAGQRIRVRDLLEVAGIRAPSD